MIYLTRKAEFSASHYYHNPEWSPEENQRVFGKCANLNGHGHNYTLDVTVAGEVDAVTGRVLWRRMVGFDANPLAAAFPPTPLSSEPGSDVLVVATAHNE